ncbi:glycosyltransferase [uncultured Cloacibacillus sp.]|uniref:glycosyltransferase n=1 Tax=uncultured Cloacibacillus sp. TaxID=889794 RepID=UPI00320AEBB0
MEYLPLVSIIIPVYNGSNFLREAIDSALDQTYKNIEIIVVNDGSSDNGATESIALSYEDRVRYYKKDNGGVSSALNLGLKQMRGDYFSWLSHDDKYTSEKIQKEIELLAAYTNKKVVAYCGSQLIDKDSKALAYRHLHTSLSEVQLNTWQEALKLLFVEGTYNGCAFLIPRAAFDSTGWFDEDLRFNQDALMWAKLFLNEYGIVYTSYIGVLSRVHNAQLTQRGQDIFHRDCCRMSDFLVHELLKIKSTQDNFLYYYAMNNAKYQNKEIVEKCLCAANCKRLFSCRQIMSIYGMSAYGCIRPLLRKIYHKVFNNISTR